VVHRAAGFHDDQADTAVDEPALELAARQALGFNGKPLFFVHLVAMLTT
jgi:hypothetical protein